MVAQGISTIVPGIPGVSVIPSLAPAGVPGMPGVPSIPAMLGFPSGLAAPVRPPVTSAPRQIDYGFGTDKK